MRSTPVLKCSDCGIEGNPAEVIFTLTAGALLKAKRLLICRKCRGNLNEQVASEKEYRIEQGELNER